jgi:hypothetical protein
LNALLAEHGIYIQPINYPAVPHGTGRLCITPAPYHDDQLIEALAEGLVDVWRRLGLPLRCRARGTGGNPRNEILRWRHVTSSPARRSKRAPPPAAVLLFSYRRAA